jgi:hypothetical protein
MKALFTINCKIFNMIIYQPKVQAANLNVRPIDPTLVCYWLLPIIVVSIYGVICLQNKFFSSCFVIISFNFQHLFTQT